jgi:hypothetical protein
MNEEDLRTTVEAMKETTQHGCPHSPAQIKFTLPDNAAVELFRQLEASHAADLSYTMSTLNSLVATTANPVRVVFTTKQGETDGPGTPIFYLTGVKVEDRLAIVSIGME